MNVAIVHDWLTSMGGAERIVRVLHALFPEAPIYTTVYNRKSMPPDFAKMDVRTSFLQKMPFGVRKYQAYLPLMPLAVESFDLRGYDLVISSSSACAKGVITSADTLHLCYCNTPMRYGWEMFHGYVENKGWFSKAMISLMMHRIRMWDRLSADRVDVFLANSGNVARRIEKVYRRTSEVVYPPVRTDFYTPGSGNGGYYLVVSRLVGYKRVDLAVRAFRELDLPLVVVGDGSEMKRLKAMAGKRTTFRGRISDEAVRDAYRGCKAFLFPGEEDFGIAPLEAQACGRPVLAFGKGGALETVVDGKTGLFFFAQTPQALVQVVKRFEQTQDRFDPRVIRAHALKFSESEFKQRLIEKIELATGTV